MTQKNLLVTTDCVLPRWDGIARFLSEIIPELKKHFTVTILAPEFGGKPFTVPGVRIIKLPVYSLKFGDIYFSRFKYKLIKKEAGKADLIFNQTIGPIGICAIIAGHGKKNLVSYVHSIEWELASEGAKHFHRLIKFFVKRLARYLYNKCGMLMVPSREVKSLLEKNKIWTKKEVVKLGVDAEKFKPLFDKNKAKEKIGISPNKFVIGFVGRFGREKDVHTLYKAFLQINKKYYNTVLLLIGQGGEKYKHKNIIMPGAQKDVVPYLQAMDVFVLPSLTETSSLSTMEAMSCGVAVIATPVGNVKKYLKEGINGLLFPKKDAKALAEKIEGLIMDEKTLRKLGEEGRKTIEANYNWKETAKKIVDVLKNY